MKMLTFPSIVAVVSGVAIYLWGGVAALMLLVILATLETTLSFDNAVVNAKVLGRMNERWQRRFLTWGIPVAVFGTRIRSRDPYRGAGRRDFIHRHSGHRAIV